MTYVSSIGCYPILLTLSQVATSLDFTVVSVFHRIVQTYQQELKLTCSKFRAIKVCTCCSWVQNEHIRTHKNENRCLAFIKTLFLS